MTSVLLLAMLTTAAPAPPCWIRGDPADLELRISPLDSAVAVLGSDTVKLCYSRPRALGRPIMGRLVPFGEAWRLGANEATTLHAPVALRIGDARIEPGAHSLYAVPDSTSWRLVINGGVQRWGVPISEEVRQADRDTIIVAVESNPEPVEMLTMRFDQTGEDEVVELVIFWERTLVRVPIRRAEP